jgi:hypothetical protein
VHESDTAEGVMPGRLVTGTLDFEPGYGRSIRSPAANSEDEQREEGYERALLRIRGVVKPTVTSLVQKTPYPQVPSSTLRGHPIGQDNRL